MLEEADEARGKLEAGSAGASSSRGVREGEVVADDLAKKLVGTRGWERFGERDRREWRRTEIDG